MKWLRVKFNCMGGGGNKLDLMLADVCGGGTYMCCRFLYVSGSGFLVSMCPLRDILKVSLCTKSVISLLLFSSVALIVLHTHLLALCLCYIGDIVCNLVLSSFMSLWLSLLVCTL